MDEFISLAVGFGWESGLFRSVTCCWLVILFILGWEARSSLCT